MVHMCLFWFSGFSALSKPLELECVNSSKLFFSVMRSELLKSLECLVFILMQDTEGYTFHPLGNDLLYYCAVVR